MSDTGLASALAECIGADFVRVEPDTVSAAPRNATQIAALFDVCASARACAAIRGAGTRPALAPRAKVVISTARLDAIDVVDGDEGVAHAGAGVCVARLRDAVHAVGWELPLDPVSPHATLGGVLASAESAPRMRGFGRPRDVVLGMEVVLGSGEHTRCGGRVVKNVSGYDLAKLWIGSRGSLGVIEAAWLRLRPRPEATRVVLRPVAHATEGITQGLTAADLACARAVLVVDDEIARRVDPALTQAGLWLLVELAGPLALVDTFARRLGGVADARVLDGAAFEGVHGWLDESARGSDPALRFACAPSRLACAIETLRALGARCVAHPEAGLVHARFPRLVDLTATRALGEVIRSLVRTTAASLRLEGGEWPEEVRIAEPVAARVIEILRSLKQQFDPRGVLAAAIPGLDLAAAGGSAA